MARAAEVLEVWYCQLASQRRYRVARVRGSRRVAALEGLHSASQHSGREVHWNAK